MTVQFRVSAEAEAQCLPRLVDQFAQRGLIPSMLSTIHVGRTLEITIEHPTMDDISARLICERMERMPSVGSASVRRMRNA